jgi:SpoVK/Ycf46/Vps4 family AAA+-type ATPase
MDDLVLTDESRAGLQRLVYFARHRDRVREQRPGAQRLDLTRGPLCLLSGRPGTGKTLAAEVIAGELGVPLFVVDLSRLVSKYVGETESHVDEALAEAQSAEAVLLFDEADTVFSRRIEHASTGGEHFANMLAGYLLQRVERHDGVILLASNLQYAIDEAFLRRFDFHVEFPLPRRDQRRAIWSLLVAGRVDDAVCDRLATHRLSGGEIRNATVKAVFLAEQDGAALCADHLHEGVRLQALESGRVSRTVAAAPDGGAVLRGLVEQLDEVLRDHLAACFRKEVHVVHGAPTEERLSGQRPAVNVALFRLARSRGRLRAGLMVSAWANRAEEEYEVLGAVQELLAAPRNLVVHGRPVTQRLHESHDFDLIHRYWSSHDRPVRPCLVIDVEVTEADADGRSGTSARS